MANKRKQRPLLSGKYPKPKSNKYAWGGGAFSWGHETDGKIDKGLFKGMSGETAQGIMSVAAPMIGGFANSALSDGMTSGAGDALGKIGQLGSAIPGSVGMAVSVGAQIAGGLATRAFGSKLNQENINQATDNINQMNNFKSTATSFDELGANMANAPAGLGFGQSFIGKDGAFSHKARNKYNELKAKQEKAIASVENNLNNNLNNISESQGQSLLANYAAYGGDLSTQGADFSNGYYYIGNGGTHENNPNEGVQVGVDPQGIPNLVEEGEVVYNDYVFSNRLTVPEEMKKKYKLGKKKGMSFADAFKRVAKESEERPNDPISKRGLEKAAGDLMQAQEVERYKRMSPEEKAQLAQQQMAQEQAMQEQQMAQQETAQQPMGLEGGEYAHGGRLGNLFGSGGIPLSSFKPREVQVDDIPLMKPKPLVGGFGSGAAIREPVISKEQQKEIENLYPNYLKSLQNRPKKNLAPTWMRYAPVVGSAIGIAQNLLSKPDYYAANRMEEAANKVADYNEVKFNPIGDYLTYNPLDRQYSNNLLNAAAGATRRALRNSGLGAGTGASILAADNNYLNQVGNMFKQAEEYNLNQRQKVAEFNRGTNQYNSEGDLKAQMANQSARQQASNMYLNGISQSLALRNATDTQRAASLTANLTNMFNSLGAIGKENMARNMVNSNPAWYYQLDGKGGVTYRDEFWRLPAEEQARVRKAVEFDLANNNTSKTTATEAANGGYLTINRRKRR